MTAFNHPVDRWLDRFAAQSPRRQLTLVLLVSFLVLAAAQPLNLIHGFMDREEATTYFRYARFASPLRAFLAPHQQYYSIFPNVVTLFTAHFLPLLSVATFEAWVAICVPLSTIYTVWHCERFTTVRARLLAVGAVLFAPGMCIVMVGCTQVQFAFALQCLIVLISDVHRHRFSRTMSVLLGGLNGVSTCMLLPFFLLRAWRERNRTTLWHAAFILACTVMEAAVLAHDIPFSIRSNLRLRPPELYIDMMTTHLLVLPFLTRFVYHPVTLLGRLTPPYWIAFAIPGILGFVLLMRLVWPAGKLARTVMAMGYFFAAAVVMGQDNPAVTLWGGNERYYYVPGAAIGLALVLAWQSRTLTPARHQLLGWMLGIMFLSGAIDMVRFWHFNQSGPVWADQIRAWQKDPANVTLTANPDYWNVVTMHLTPKPVRVNAPSYIFDSNLRPEVRASLPQDWYSAYPTTALEQ